MNLLDNPFEMNLLDVVENPFEFVKNNHLM